MSAGGRSKVPDQMRTVYMARSITYPPLKLKSPGFAPLQSRHWYAVAAVVVSSSMQIPVALSEHTRRESARAISSPATKRWIPVRMPRSCKWWIDFEELRRVVCQASCVWPRLTPVYTQLSTAVSGELCVGCAYL